jgi:hypothetical protein
MTPPLVEMHPGWNALTRVAGHMVPCPRCKATFPALSKYWRWTGEQWLCRRYTCVQEDESYAGEKVPDLWEPVSRVVLPPVRDEDQEGDHIDRVLDEIGLKHR